MEKCKIQMNQFTSQISDSSCNTSYVWFGGEAGKGIRKKGQTRTIMSSRLSSLCHVHTQTAQGQKLLAAGGLEYRRVCR